MTSDSPALYCPDHEKSVLGAILFDEQHLTALLVDEHLRAEHFADTGLALIFQAAVELQDAGRPIDHMTIAAHLSESGKLERVGGAPAIEGLLAHVPVAGNAREYGRVVRTHSQKRAFVRLAEQSRAAVLARSAPISDVLEHHADRVNQIVQEGEHGARQHTWTPAQLRSEAFDDLGQPTGEVWRTPFPALDEMLGGGMCRGEQMLIAGERKMGKSQLLDGMLECFGEQGLRVHLYINEMSRRQRRNRFITRATGIPMRALKARDLTREQAKSADDAMANLKIGITECDGWTAAEISRDIKRHRWDVCGVDIAHNISRPEPGQAGWDRLASELRSAPIDADGVMLLAVHTRKRAHSVAEGLDEPTVDDIRETGMFSNLADQVLILSREREKGIPTGAGMLSLAAVRDGEPGRLAVSFQRTRLKWVPGLASDQSSTSSDQYPVDPDRFLESSGGAAF